MAKKTPLIIGTTVPIEQLGLSDTMDLPIGPSPSANQTADGVKTTLIANESQAFGDAVFINSAGKAQLGDADAIATAS